MWVLCLFHFVLLVNFGNFVKAADSQQWNDFKVTLKLVTWLSELEQNLDQKNGLKYFQIQYGKNYETTELEQQKMETFHKNMDKIAKHNEKFKKGEVLYEMGMNHFGDMVRKKVDSINHWQFFDKFSHEISKKVYEIDKYQKCVEMFVSRIRESTFIQH